MEYSKTDLKTLERSLLDILDSGDERLIYRYLKRITGLDEDGELMDIEAYCKHYDINIENIKSYKMITTPSGVPLYNITYNNIDGAGVTNQRVVEIVTSLVEKGIEIADRSNPLLQKNDLGGDFDRLIWSDVHIAMHPNPDGLHTYDDEWNEKQLFLRIDKMIEFVLLNKTSSVLFIDELGDFLDGFQGQTTRGGHELPQNMSDSEAFQVALRAKKYLVDGLASHYDFITCRNITNDNHAGDFSSLLAYSAKITVELTNTNVKFKNQDKFLDYYVNGNHVHILTHGKDKQHMKFGLGVVPKPKDLNLISSFIRHHDLESKGKYIHLSKGDSHQMLFDYCSSEQFMYYNYPSFAPPSSWIAHNFGKSPSGFVFETYRNDMMIPVIRPFFF